MTGRASVRAEAVCLPRIDKLIVISLPKSGTVFIQRVFEASLGATHFRLSPPGGSLTYELQESVAEALKEKDGPVLAGDHLPASENNLRLLASIGIRRIAVIVRDPRDAIVSWWHHLEREDIRSHSSATAQLVQAGLMSANYYSLSIEERLSDLIERMFPAMQQWLAQWALAMDQGKGFTFLLCRYEDFVIDQRRTLAGIFKLFGRDEEIIMPERNSGKVSGGIDLFTHFRRGIVGSHRDETPPALLRRLNSLCAPEVFERFGWKDRETMTWQP